MESKKSKQNVQEQSDFTIGSVRSAILRLAIPMTLAQLVSLLYNIIDRMYIGHLPENSTLALTGLGLTFPILTVITAFSNLFGMGGAPLFSIARGKKQSHRAEEIMGNTFTMLVLTGAVLTVLGLFVKRPVLYLFGASDATIGYADDYLSIYLCGSIFVMISLGMNGFINAQGFAKKGMLTVLIGAVLNIILDPIFIFVMDWGVRGAAAATVISQMVSAVWVMKFLTGKQAILHLKRRYLKVRLKMLKEIVALGMSGFIMSVTNSIVQVVCNATLQIYGGDLYIGIMTVVNSVREIVTMPISGLTNAAQPVLGYNYGARAYRRVREGIKFMTLSGIAYMLIIWAVLFVFPEQFIHIFNSDPQLLKNGVTPMHIYFFGFFMMAFQFSGQSTFVALGKSRQAVFFSIFRKVIIVVPLTLLLPQVAKLGVMGVFLAEPISNFIGGLASFGTMMATVWRKLKEPPKENQAGATNA